MVGFRRSFVIAAAASMFPGCATQPIEIDCVPEEVVVYVDGEKLERVPESLELRTDRPHTLYFKGPGVEPELVVLNQTKVAGRAALEPSEVCLEARYTRVDRKVDVAIDPAFASDPDVSAGPPIDSDGRGTVDLERPTEFELDLP